MLKVAARFDVSSSYMARICTQLNVPRPERGYWAKLAVGKAPNQPKLPDPRPGELLEWTRDGTPPKSSQVLPIPPEKFHRKPRKALASRTDQHLLVVGAKPFFESGRLSYSTEYLKPAKRLLVDLAVTKTGLDKALSFANTLFLTLENCDYRVTIAPHTERFHRAEVDERESSGRTRNFSELWSPQRCTVVYIGTVAIGLTIIEMSEEVEARYVNGKYIRINEDSQKRRSRTILDYGWTSKHEFPTGRLCLQAYSPYPRAKWTRQWREIKNTDLSNQIPAIIRELEKATQEIAQLVEEGERQAEEERKQWEIQQEIWRHEKEVRQAAENLAESKTELHEIIDAWAAAKRIEAFFADAESRLDNLPKDERIHIQDRLQRAREIIGSTDPLIRFQSWKSPDER